MFEKQHMVGRDVASVSPMGPAVMATPRTIPNFIEADTFAVQYVDDDGRLHTTLVHRVGGVWQLPPNGENYAATLRPLGRDSWLAKALDKKFEAFELRFEPKVPADAGDVA